MLNKLLNIKYPIIQGAMANIATAEFAACVSQCGGSVSYTHLDVYKRQLLY